MQRKFKIRYDMIINANRDIDSFYSNDFEIQFNLSCPTSTFEGDQMRYYGNQINRNIVDAS